MTTTLRDIMGFETEGLEEATTTSGSPAVNTSAPIRSGLGSLKLDGAATQAVYSIPGFGTITTTGLPSGSNSDTHNLGGFAVYFTDLSPATAFEFCKYRDDSNGDYARLVLDTNGDLLVRDSTGATVTNGTIGAPFTVNTWHFIEFYAEHVGSGAWEILIDGTTQQSGTGEDFLITNPNARRIHFQGPLATTDGDVRIDDVYALTDDAAQPTELSNGAGGNLFEVFPYQQDKAATAADAGLTTNDDTLTFGAPNNWAVAGEVPFGGSSAGYTATADGAVVYDEGANAAGHAGGPSTGAPYDVSGTIRGAKWIWNIERGAGGGSEHRAWYGNGADTPITRSADMALGTSKSLRLFVSVAAGEVPTASEDFAQGFETTGARDVECGDMLAYLAHSPSALDVAELAALWPKGQQEPMFAPPEVVSYG